MNDKDRLRIFLYICHGHVLGPKHCLIGATDGELGRAFPRTMFSSMRYVRWNLTKHGYLKDHGVPRAIGPGKPKMKVWVPTDKWLPDESLLTNIEDVLNALKGIVPDKETIYTDATVVPDSSS